MHYFYILDYQYYGWSIMYEDIKEIKILLLKHCQELGILKPMSELKKVNAVLNSLIQAVIDAELSLEDLKKCITDVDNGKVINLNFFKNGGDLFTDYINPHWVKFAKSLWEQRSVGLGTPNAASGEGELMFLFLSKDIKKPTKGDLKIGNEILELKGYDPRVSGKISGKEFRLKTMKICQKFNLTPNKALKIKIDAVEIEKPQHLDHWKAELAKLSMPKQKEFINEWLKCIDDKEHNDSVEKIFNNNSFNQNILIKEIIKILYSIMVDTGNFDKFILLDEGKNVKIVSKNKEEFNKKIDDGEIVPVGDYFRINQDFNIGWYIT